MYHDYAYFYKNNNAQEKTFYVIEYTNKNHLISPFIYSVLCTNVSFVTIMQGSSHDVNDRIDRPEIVA